MKKILNILKIITIIIISMISLVSCNIEKYTKKELIQLKEKNKIKTTNQEIKNNLEWIAPQEKPFNVIDNKWYFVIWRGNKNYDWKIIKFKNNIYLYNYSTKRKIDNLNGYELNLINSGIRGVNLNIYKFNLFTFSHWWNNKNDNYFKSVYRWNGKNNIYNLNIFLYN